MERNIHVNILFGKLHWYIYCERFYWNVEGIVAGRCQLTGKHVVCVHDIWKIKVEL